MPEPTNGDVVASNETLHIARTLESSTIHVIDPLGESVAVEDTLAVTAWTGQLYWSDVDGVPVCHEDPPFPFGPLPSCYQSHRHSLPNAGETRLLLLRPRADTESFHVEWNTPVVGNLASTEGTSSPIEWVALSDLAR